METIHSIEFGKDGIGLKAAQIADGKEVHSMTDVISWEKARKIYDAFDLYYAMEDIKVRLTDIYETDEKSDTAETRESTDPNLKDAYCYDREKFTPDVLCKLAKDIIERKAECDIIGDRYYNIIGNVLEEFEKSATGKD